VELDIHGTPSTHYSMLVDESRSSAFQAVTRFPLECASPPYIDVGASIELTIHNSDGKVILTGTIDITRITGQVCLGLCVPIVAQQKVEFNTTVELDKAIPIVNDGSVTVTVTRP
jgi:hypothetical protein